MGQQNCNRREQLIQFRSFEDTLALLGAVAVAVIAYKIFKASALTTILLGVLSAAAVAYITLYEFTLQDDVITCRSRFHQISFRCAWVERPRIATFYAGLPGHILMFLMRKPPAPVNGHGLRTGLVSWPSATRWVEAVNSTISSRGPTNNSAGSSTRG